MLPPQRPARVVLLAAVAAAALDARRRRPRAARAADPGRRDRLRDHLGARLAPAARRDRRDRAARRRALPRRRHPAVEADHAQPHARLQGLPADGAPQRGVSGGRRSCSSRSARRRGCAPRTPSSRRASSAPAPASRSPRRPRRRGRSHARADRPRLGAARRARAAQRSARRVAPRRGDLLDDHRGAARARARGDPLRRARRAQPARPPRRLAAPARARACSPARRCCCPVSEEALAGAPAGHAPAVVVPIAVEPSGPRCRRCATSPRSPTPPTRTRRASTACSRPGRRARRDGEELLVAGRRAGRGAPRACARSARWRATHTARCCAARASTSPAPRREEYGIAQLEALADGAMLVAAGRRPPTPRSRSPAPPTRGWSAATSRARSAPRSTIRCPATPRGRAALERVQRARASTALVAERVLPALLRARLSVARSAGHGSVLAICARPEPRAPRGPDAVAQVRRSARASGRRS